MKTKAIALKTPETPLYLSGEGWKISIGKDAQAIKKEMLDSAKEIIKVTSNEEAVLAKSQRDDLNAMLIDVEKYRKIVKQPVLDKGREIDQCASTFTHEITEEKLRLDKLLGGFAAKQEEIRRKAEAERQRLQAEADRIAQQQREAEEAAERKRIGAERAAAEAETARERMLADKALKEAEAKAREADELLHQQGAAEMSAFQSGLTVQQSHVKGVRPSLDFEVTDIGRLYAADPSLVDLTPKRREILKRLAAQQELGQAVGIPGVRVVEGFKVR